MNLQIRLLQGGHYRETISKSCDHQNCSQVLSKSAAFLGGIDLPLALVCDRDNVVYTYNSAHLNPLQPTGAHSNPSPFVRVNPFQPIVT